jgi:putative oxygen-independent coproporphyrinogen III oxidase
MAVSKINAAPLMGVYIHWPFCESKCPYCDFNSHVEDAIDHSRWRQALLTELSYFANDTKGRTVTSIFFGGGTPSLMDPETTADLINAVKSHWAIKKGMEITLEANPTTAEVGRFNAFREAGINRLSLGIQSLNDRNLKYLGRRHSVADSKKAINLAASIFPRFSVDLMYGLPRQTRSNWQEELNSAIGFAGDHLSVYQLTIEPGTPFFRDKVPAANEKIGTVLYQDTQTILENSGFISYEISNHAREGQHCRHNVDIWRGGDYAGIGPGAHGRLTGPSGTDAIYQIHNPSRWLDKVERNGHATAKRSPTGIRGRAEELLLTGLRLSDGISSDILVDVETIINKKKLELMICTGFLERDDKGLRATNSGRLCLNEVLCQLLEDF